MSSFGSLAATVARDFQVINCKSQLCLVCFVPILYVFFVFFANIVFLLDLFSSVLSLYIGSEERLGNDLFCIELDDVVLLTALSPLTGRE